MSVASADRKFEAALPSDMAHTTILETERRTSSLTDLKEILWELWEYRELLSIFTSRGIRVRYKQAVMGLGWAVFMPAMIVGAGIVVKFALTYVSGSSLDQESVSRTMVKAIPWSFFVGAIGFATSSLTGSQGLVTRIYFPKEIIPISTVLGQTFDSALSGGTTLLIIMLLGSTPTIHWFWLLLLVPTMILLTLAAALVLSCGNLFFRDVKYIVQVLIMFGIFVTPVFFEPHVFGPAGPFMMLNPLSPILEGSRLCLVDGHNLLSSLSIIDAHGVVRLVWTPWYLAYSVGIATMAAVFGAVFFHRSEFLFAEYL